MEPFRRKAKLKSAAFLGAGLVLAALPEGGRGLSAGTLEADVRDLVNQQGFDLQEVAVAVISDGGKLVVGINHEEPFRPASNQKVLITAAAAYWLGLDHLYETTLTSTQALQAGLIDGDLIVRGHGDPNISGRFQGGDPTALLKSWAQDLRKKGLKEVKGDLIADDTYFDDVRFPVAWDRRQEDAWYSAQVSALSLNDNCVDITVRVGSKAGAPARVEAVPSCPFLQLSGAPLTVTEGPTKIVVHRKTRTNEISVKGQINIRSPSWSGNVTIDDPALFFASTLAQVLKKEGISIRGRVRKMERSATSVAGPVKNEAKSLEASAEKSHEHLLLRHTSTLRQDLPIINKRSQNLHAEILLKVLGARVSGEGSLEGGERAVRKFLKEKKIPDERLVLVDGSGLSHKNRVTASLLARVLHSVRSEKYSQEYLRSLPVAGEDGTLDDRFQGNPEVKGKVFAKTGYIAGVSCLSGYVSKGDRVWSFSILVSGLRGGAHAAKRLEEKIAARIYREIP